MSTFSKKQTSLGVKDLKKTADFLIEKIGFTIIKERAAKNAGDVVSIADKYGNIFNLFLMPQGDKKIGNETDAVFYTDDCLREYYDLNLKGINCINKPHYVKKGLTFDFSDEWGNSFTFLEQRRYGEES
jgi:glyoxalase/bleomycin resistance protein/dioxygenase superfamily protein